MDAEPTAPKPDLVGGLLKASEDGRLCGSVGQEPVRQAAVSRPQPEETLIPGIGRRDRGRSPDADRSLEEPGEEPVAREKLAEGFEQTGEHASSRDSIGALLSILSGITLAQEHRSAAIAARRLPWTET
jgi:hypothetical protein